MYCKTRLHLTQQDFMFISKTIGTTEKNQTAILKLSDDVEATTELLHHNSLFPQIISSSSMTTVSPWLYFYEMVYHALKTKHLEDDDLVDYVSSVCVDFSQSDILWHFASASGEKMIYIVDMLQVMKDLKEVQQYYMHQYIGNVSLFLTGFFPDLIFQRNKRKGAPSFDYYESVGQTEFEAAAQSSLLYEADASPVLFKLAEYFTDVRSAINVYVDSYLSLHSQKSVLKRIDRQSATLDEESFRELVKL
ncbi:MAG: hypothetical protein HYZ34_01695 [Ignavibacteriae bacterium]|nr:hypothetical protein [Ignavibacteriota bacterium]